MDQSRWGGDAGVSPVMGALFLVAITVGMSGTVFLTFGDIGPKPIPKFPQVPLMDAGGPMTTSTPGDPLAHLVHRGGDRLLWGDFTITVLRAGEPATGASAVAFSSRPDCSPATAQPEGILDVGQALYVCATGGGWGHGDAMMVRIVHAAASNTILYETTVQLQ